MAPNVAAVARAMSDNVLDQIVGQSGGGGDSHHHRHHHGTDHDFSFNGTSSNGGSEEMEILSRTSEQHRMGLIVTLSFSILAALIVIYTIVHDAYRVRPGEVYSRAQKQPNLFSKLHPAEVFPFITSVVILIQAFIFLGVQAGGIENFETSGCRLTAELIWPAYFLVIFVILTFSLETTLRALSKNPFQPRGKFTTPICIFAVALFLLGLWLTAFFFPSLDQCPASLAWWTVNYSKVGIILTGGIVLTHFVTGAIITWQLLSTAEIDGDERIAASRVVYTMIINMIIVALILPFWLQVLIGQFPIESSKVSDIGITLTGMVFGAMHIFSRANAERLAIRPKNMPWSLNKKLRLFGSSDLSNRSYISAPLLEPKMSVRSQQTTPSPVPQHPTPNEPPPDYAAMPPNMPRDFTAQATGPAPPRPPRSLDFSRPYPLESEAMPTYAGFTTEAHPGTPVETDASRYRQPSDTPSDAPSEGSVLSAYSAGSIQPPAPLFAARHDRQDSNMTSASIEIGLRLSGPMPDMQGPLGAQSVEPSGTPSTQMLPARAMSNFSYGPGVDLEKNLPQAPQPTPQQQADGPEKPTIQTSPPPPALKTTVTPPPMNVGIGALGQGPKGGLKVNPNQPQRTSPLANVMKVDSPTPTEKSNPFDSPQSTKSPPNLTPPAITGLPRSPSPRVRSPGAPAPTSSPHKTPSPTKFPPRPVRTRSTTSEPETPAVDSPTDWPQWGNQPANEWPSGEQVNVSEETRRWA